MPRPSVTAGKTRLAGESAPDTGSQPSQTENGNTSRGPRKKFGNDAPSSANPVAALSGQRPRWRAESAPSGIATASAIEPAAAASRSVAGSRPRMSAETGVPSRSERPRSPCAARRRKPDVLLEERTIEAEGRAQADAIGRRGGFAEHDVDGIAGNQMDEEEDQCRHAEEGRQGQQELDGGPRS